MIRTRFFTLLLFVFFVPAILSADDEISDPIEPVNRGIFWFNDTFDEYIGEPAAKGYDWATPDSVQNCVKNFFRNLRYPIQLVSNLAQFRFEAAADDTGRFLVNSTAGVLGLFDVYGGEYDRQDLGTALASYGVPEGPYLVIPILGPSNLRDFTGAIGGFFLDPVYILYFTDRINGDTQLGVGAGLYTLEYLNTRARYLDIFRDMKENSVDYYLAQQSFYLQYRRGLINGEKTDDEIFDDELFDDDEDFETEDLEAEAEEVTEEGQTVGEVTE